MSNFKDVLQFHRQMGLPVGDFYNPQILDADLMQQRLDFMEEELHEIIDAFNLLESAKELKLDTEYLRFMILPKIFDGLLDLVYVACGTGVMMGLPWEEGWDLVQFANMAKRREEGKDGEHHRGIIKPPGWREPDLTGLLEDLRAGLSEAPRNYQDTQEQS